MSIEKVIEAFCCQKNITFNELFGVQRGVTIWYTRYMIWYYLHCECGISATQLSQRFFRNRPSIFRGIRLLKHQMKYSKALRDEYDSVIKKIEDADNSTPPFGYE